MEEGDDDGVAVLNSLSLTFIAAVSSSVHPPITTHKTALMQSRVISARAGTAAPSLAARRAAPARAKCVSVRAQAAATTTKLNTSKSEAVRGVLLCRFGFQGIESLII